MPFKPTWPQSRMLIPDAPGCAYFGETQLPFKDRVFAYGDVQVYHRRSGSIGLNKKFKKEAGFLFAKKAEYYAVFCQNSVELCYFLLKFCEKRVAFMSKLCENIVLLFCQSFAILKKKLAISQLHAFGRLLKRFSDVPPMLLRMRRRTGLRAFTLERLSGLLK